MRRLAALAIAGLTVASIARAQQAPLIALLDTYFQGHYDEAVRKAAATADLGPLRVRFVQDVPVWVRSDPARLEARRAAAAAFVLELTHARLESDWRRLDDLIEVMCADLRAGNPSPAFELAWHRASIALAGRARARLWLLGEYAVLPHQKPRRRPPDSKPDPNPRHLMHALDRFPDDRELQLARVVAWTWSRDQEPMRNLRLRGDDERPFARPASQKHEAIRALEPLTGDPAVGAEALVRIAQLRVAAAEPDQALRAAERAEAHATAAPAVRYLALFFGARALEALNRPDEAVRKYHAALDVVPRADSATVALASLHFVRDDRERAVALFGSTFDAPASAVDPGRLVGYGSFMHWPRLRAALRAELAR